MKYIRYGSGAMYGKICEDIIKVYNAQEMQAKTPFLINELSRDNGPT
jgi:hypothetical protein